MAHLAHWRHQLKSDLVGHSMMDQVLPTAVVEAECRRSGRAWRSSCWSPTTTLATFLLQVLSAEKTLRAAVAALLAQLAARGEKAFPSVDASAYCQTRIRLPMRAIECMLDRVVAQMRSLVDAQSGWLPIGHNAFSSSDFLLRSCRISLDEIGMPH